MELIMQVFLIFDRTSAPGFGFAAKAAVLLVTDLWCMLWINSQRMVAEGKSREQHIKQIKKSNVFIIRLSSASYFNFHVVYYTINLSISELGGETVPEPLECFFSLV